MTIDVFLAIIALIVVIIGVLGEAYDPKFKKFVINRYGYASITAGLVLCAAMIYKAHQDTSDKAGLDAQLTRVEGQLVISETNLAMTRDELLAATQREGSRLRPIDFQIRLLVIYRVEQATEMPQTVAISGRIGKAIYQGELKYTEARRRIPGGGRGLGYYIYRYFVDNLTVGGLEKYPYSDNLNGEVFRASFEASRFPPKESEVNMMRRLQLDFYVQGRHFGILSYSEGEFETILEFVDDAIDSKKN